MLDKYGLLITSWNEWRPFLSFKIWFKLKIILIKVFRGSAHIFDFGAINEAMPAVYKFASLLTFEYDSEVLNLSEVGRWAEVQGIFAWT